MSRPTPNGPGYSDVEARTVGRLYEEIDERWEYIDAKIEAWDATAQALREEAESMADLMLRGGSGGGWNRSAGVRRRRGR